MAKFAVAYFGLLDNNLELSFVEADDWRSALVATKHVSEDGLASFEGLSYEQARDEALNQDWHFAVEEVK